MTPDFATKRLRATTVAIDDPGDLLRFLDAEHSTAFVRQGEGIVTLGEVARFETDYADAADVWWTETASHIDHDSELPGAFGTGPLAIGSFAFDPENTRSRSILVVPETIIGRRAGHAWMTRISEGRSSLDLPEAAEPPAAPTGLELMPDGLPEAEWEDLVRDVVALIHSDSVSKVVLARSLKARASSPLDPRHILGRLVERYPMVWSYLVDGLVGATPELLVRRQHQLVTSRVLAGTVSIDPDHTDPVSRIGQLTSSGKDISEHEFAVASVAEALEPYCAAMNVPEAPSVLTLPNVMHLATDITGVSDPEVSSLALAAALHPSAAVCGTPTHLAGSIIAQRESLDRGRYAGPVGWVDAAGDGEWAIALRGGYINPAQPDEIRLYAGAGIVADSDPASELAETLAKFRPMLDALGL
ncbi:isochorismate synthase MenF [Arachnia propionica]|uniref:isochorismate synthase n=1 Tax=Arachnia propionica TaxID=1750 RepID=A0A3P1WTX6_9ACTN|nr:isochorismate synthase [Arachnia propionica]RRD50004.1 isochorismate synthase [Arachnia propionica]